MRLVRGDVREPGSLVELLTGAQVIFHLAAGTQGEWQDYYQSTVEGTRHLLEAARRCGVRRVVYASSSGVYRSDGLPRGTVIEETSPLEEALEKRTYYIRAKLLAEQVVLEAMGAGELSIVNLRPALVYGRESAFCGALFPSLGGRVHLGLGNPGRQVALVYVDDLADAFLVAWEKAPAAGAIYNIGDEASPSYREYFEMHRKLTGHRRPVFYVPYPLLAAPAAVLDGLGRLRNSGERVEISHRLKAFCGDVRYSSRKAREELGWTAGTRFAAGMRLALGLAAAEDN